jgi:hypothetical protein
LAQLPRFSKSWFMRSTADADSDIGHENNKKNNRILEEYSKIIISENYWYLFTSDGQDKILPMRYPILYRNFGNSIVSDTAFHHQYHYLDTIS